MRIHQKALAVLAGAASLAALASGAAEAADLKIMFQGDPFEIAAIQGAASRFEAAHPGTKIELINTPHDA